MNLRQLLGSYKTMKDIKERVAIVEQVAASSHKRIDSHDNEILSLRESRHKHANDIQKHTGFIELHTDILSGITAAVKDLTKSVDSFKVMAATAMVMGSVFITFCGFVGGKLLGWWEW